MDLNYISIQWAFVLWWETRGNDITPLGWTGQALIETSMFSKAALMLTSCLNKQAIIWVEGREFLFEVYASALSFCPQIPVSNIRAQVFLFWQRNDLFAFRLTRFAEEMLHFY